MALTKVPPGGTNLQGGATSGLSHRPLVLNPTTALYRSLFPSSLGHTSCISSCIYPPSQKGGK
eukprot:5899633-Karenia_brevis.AAC.1